MKSLFPGSLTTGSSLIPLGLFCLFGSALAAAPRPNVVWIMADDLGFSDIGLFGGEIDTPHLDAIGEAGVRYTQFYNAARCCPTRAALLTGLYPHQAGVGHMIDGYAARERAAFDSPAYTDHLSPKTPTVAEALQSAGYRTFMAGKWHLGYRPQEHPAARGFDRSFALIGGAMNYYGYGPQLVKPTGVQANVLMMLDGERYTLPRDGFFATDAFTDYAIEFIRDHRGEEGPYFLYLAYNAPHWPLHARPKTIAKYRGKYKEGWDVLRARRHARLVESGIIDADWPQAPRPAELPAWEELSEEKQDRWDEWMAVYAAQVEEMDTAIGRLISAIRETDGTDNTLILFFSDNGGAAERPVKTIEGAKLGTRESYEGYDLDGAHVSSAPFRKTKKFTHEGGIATPLLASWPDGIDSSLQGGFNHEIGHITDLMATVLELAGAEIPTGAETLPPEGISLAPTFTGRPLTRTNPIFWEHEGHRAVRDGRWKIVSSHGDSWELYDLEADRTECVDLASTLPDVLKRLAAAYLSWAERTGVLPWTTLPPPE